MICFISFDQHGLDLHSSLPIIIELSKKNQIEVLLFNNFSFETKSGIFKTLDLNKIKIVNFDQILFNDRFGNIKNNFLKILLKRIFLKFKILGLKKILNRLKKFDIIIGSSVNLKLIPEFQKKLYGKIKNSKSIFIGQQLIPTHTLYYEKVFDFDIYLSNSKNEFEKISKNTKIKSYFFGSMSLEKNKLENLVSLTKNYHNKYDFVLVLNNLNQRISANYSSLIELKKFIEEFKSFDVSFLIKVHPKNDINFFKKEINSKHLIEIDELLEDSICRGKNIIFFTSNGIFKSVALGKNTYHYLPKSFKKYDFIKNFDSWDDWMSNMYLIKKNNEFTNSYSHSLYCKEINYPSDIKNILEIKNSNNNKVFIENFNPEGSTNRIVNFIENIKFKN